MSALFEMQRTTNLTLSRATMLLRMVEIGDIWTPRQSDGRGDPRRSVSMSNLFYELAYVIDLLKKTLQIGIADLIGQAWDQRLCLFSKLATERS